MTRITQKHVDLARSIFNTVIQGRTDIDLVESTKHLPKDDILKTLQFLNSLYMNYFLNPEQYRYPVFNGDGYYIILDLVSKSNKQLKEISANLRLPIEEYRNNQINKILDKR